MPNHIKPVFKCKDLYKESFKNSQCLLTVSVGQEVHEGEKFAATVELVNKSFGSCVMLIDDSLQRHTMALNTRGTADFFYKLSLEEGHLWLVRNVNHYSKLTILKNIIRWNTWLEHPNYHNQKEKIESLITCDSLYKYAFESTVTEFLGRYWRRLENRSDFDEKRAWQLCWDYLIEECTAFCLWPELQCQFEVYPSTRNLAMSETHKRFVMPYCENLLHSVSIKFKNRKQLQPQKFGSLLND